MTTRLRRTIYIGIGGTGLETISMVKKYFREMSPSGELPPMIKFLAIDTDPDSQLMQGFTTEERLSLAERNAKPIYVANKNLYKNLPNKESIRALSAGAGQIRSLGKFAVTLKEYHGNMSFTDKFNQAYDNVQNINSNDENYEVLGTDVEVHIVFSLSGGTGSGSFLSIAYLIRQINPNLKIVGYAFSHSFFVNLPTCERIKQNAYASLLELDYCMHAENERYQDIEYPKQQRIEQTPFDIFMYIDNKTYTTGGHERSYIYQPSDKMQVETRVAYAMVISAGDMGAAGVSVWDNLSGDINNHTYDVTLSGTNHTTKKGWVSSLGIGEIICSGNSEKGLFTDKLSVKILKNILATQNDSVASIDAYNWVKDFDINEGANEDDKNAVINQLISPDKFNGLTAIEINQDSISTGKQAFFQRVRISEEEITQRLNNMETQKKKEIKDRIIDSIFPQSEKSLGVEYTISVLEKFSDLMKQFAVIMINEKKDYVSRKTQALREWEDNVEALNRLRRERLVYNRDEKIQGMEEALVNSAIEEFIADCEIRRRDSAHTFFSNISSFVEGKIVSLKNLKDRIKGAIDSVEKRINSATSLPTLPARTRGTIDLTKEVVNLKTTSVDAVQYNLSIFFEQTQYATIEEFADSTNIEHLVVEYAARMYNESPVAGISQYPIIRILTSLNKTDLRKYLEIAVSKYSTPLMDIENYGEAVKDTQHIYVAIPGGKNGDEDIKKEIKNALAASESDVNWVDINDPNRILIYRQLGVIPPYFISGISSGRNGFYKSGSCQEKFEKEYGPNKYSPFTDSAFETKYIDDGFSLDSEKRTNESLNIALWVQGIILGLIIKPNNNYKVLSEIGETDVEDELFRSWYDLGENRVEAFENFSRNTDLEEEVKRSIEEMLIQRPNKEKLEAFFGRINAPKYRPISLIDFNSIEWEDTEVKKLFKKEIDFLIKR